MDVEELKARVAELEAENEILSDDLQFMTESRNKWQDAATQSRRSQGQLRGALADIARQERSDEMETEGDFEDGYDACIDLARAALAPKVTA